MSASLRVRQGVQEVFRGHGVNYRSITTRQAAWALHQRAVEGRPALPGEVRGL